MFLIRYYDFDLGHVVLPVRPAPTEVSYPDRRQFTYKPTLRGGTVIQRPSMDTRVRKWVWKAYRGSIPLYESLFTTLSNLEAKARWQAGYEPYVEIWEDVTKEGGFGSTLDGLAADLEFYTNLKWTRVVFQQVHRKTRGGGGRVVYDDTWIEFTVDDESYLEF